MSPVNNFDQLLANLKAGLRLALFLPARNFFVSRDQLVLLAGVQVGLFLLLDFIGNGLPGEFDLLALPQTLFFVLLLLLAGYTIARFQSEMRLALAVPVMALSAAPVFAAVFLGLSVLDLFGALPEARGFTFYLVYVFAVYIRGLLLIAGRPRLPANAAWMLILVIAPQLVFPRTGLWLGAAESEDPMLPEITDESVLHGQSTLFERALDGVAQERPGIADLYFIGFGGDASEDVFMKELEVARDLFDSRFDTQGRSLVLVNNRRRLERSPIATATHLAAAIERVSQKMDREDDVLVLFITSHGSENHELAVVLEPLVLQQLEPDFLRAALDRAGIEWRIIVISACYSGGFIPALASEKSLVITAADAEHPSFGCSADSEITYFGRAFFAEELARTRSLPEAFDKAVLSIAERERDKGFDPSYPQLVLGAEMKKKLAELEARLKGE